MKTPYNFETGNEYTASNADECYAVMAELGTDDPRFCTYVGAQKTGYQVPKGTSAAAKLCRIVIIKRKNKKTNKVEEKKVPKYFAVWHISQLEKAEETKPEPKAATCHDEMGEALRKYNAALSA